MKLLLTTVLLIVSALSASCQGVRYTVQNQTGQLGGATYPVTTPVQFSTLSLTLTYADSSTFTENLLGTLAPAGTKNSSVYPLVDPTRGAITTAQISGLFSTLNWQESATFLGPKTNVTVSNPFSATEPGGIFQFAFIDGVTATGTHYHAGNLSSGPAALPPITPEPGTFALLVSAGLAAACCLRRRRSI